MELYRGIVANAGGGDFVWVGRLAGWDPRARAWVSHAYEMTIRELAALGGAAADLAAGGAAVYSACVCAEVPTRAVAPGQPGEYAYAGVRVLASRPPGGAPAFVVLGDPGLPAGRVSAEVFRGDYGQDDVRADVPPRPVDARALLAALSGGDVRAAGERGWR